MPRNKARSPSSGKQQEHTVNVDDPRYKTKKCKHFEKNGKCKFGDSCIFAHGAHELRIAPPSPTTEGNRPRSDSKKLVDEKITLPITASKTSAERRPSRSSLNSPTVSESYRKVVDPTTATDSGNILPQDIMRMVGVNTAPTRKKFHRLYFMPANSIW